MLAPGSPGRPAPACRRFAGIQDPPTLSHPILSRGSIDAARLDDTELYLEGWCASDGSGPLTALALDPTIRELPAGALEKSLASPDVHAAWPGLDHADACRFRLRVPLAALDPRFDARRTVLVLTPLFSGQRGRVLSHLIEPCLPEPGPERSGVGVGFTEVAFEILRLFIDFGGLTRHQRVLDIGCGVGRMAYSLAHYLGPRATYRGFDIVPDWLEWARDNIGSRFASFTFEHVDLHNPFYRPTGVLRATEFRFPPPDGSIDFAIATSIFTHLVTAETRHYLEEAARVVTPGGRLFATVFLLDDESRAYIARGESPYPFVHQLDGCYTTDPTTPEVAIAFDRTSFLDWAGHAGFSLVSFHPGRWPGREVYTSFQDVVVLRRN